MLLVADDVAGHPVWNLRAKTPQQEQATVPWHQVIVVATFTHRHTQSIWHLHVDPRWNLEKHCCLQNVYICLAVNSNLSFEFFSISERSKCYIIEPGLNAVLR